jgi:cytochrome c oxidase subunit II
MTNKRRNAIRILAASWLIAAVVGDILLALAPIPPGKASDQASNQTHIILLLSLIGWPVFAGVIASLIFTLGINRIAPHEGEVDARSLRGHRGIQVTWIAVNSFIVLLLAVFGTIELANDQPGNGISTSAEARPLPSSPADPLEVQVIAQQWYFTYRYPTFGGIETAHLVLPVNQKIEFHITSLDVTHSFWFYALGVKADAVPLNDNVFTATPTETGTFRVQCAELCGLWHGNMSDSSAQVVSASDFTTWIQQQTALDAPVMQFLPPYSHTYAPSPLVYGM